MAALIDDIDFEVATAKHNGYADGWKAQTAFQQQQRVDAPIPTALQAQAERTLAIYTDYGRRIAQLEADGIASNHRLASRFEKLEAQLGSLQKDRYEYATLTSRVHALERYLHAGELPPDAYERLNENPGERKREAQGADESALNLLSESVNKLWGAYDELVERVKNMEANYGVQSQTLQEHNQRAHDHKQAIDGLAVHNVAHGNRMDRLEQAQKGLMANLESVTGELGARIDKQPDLSAWRSSVETRVSSCIAMMKKHESELALSRACVADMKAPGFVTLTPSYFTPQFYRSPEPQPAAHPSVYQQPGQGVPRDERAQPGVHPSVYEQPGRVLGLTDD